MANSNSRLLEGFAFSTKSFIKAQTSSRGLGQGFVEEVLEYKVHYRLTIPVQYHLCGVGRYLDTNANLFQIESLLEEVGFL